ncbi:MarR family winged helix-turn-helix transcriptional regulator [Amorphus coralli]|uniref:MarR family winged helix-turn-helix transcriptional regulator n=1 Tax=Amorphus coralli TaxID=340680 RepID=UPI00036CBC0C|nr:MarR family transcriptional regulator [Amorphus coralli]
MDKPADAKDDTALRSPLGTDEQLEFGSLASAVGFHLRLAQNASFKAFKRHTGETDLRPGWYAVLTLIHHNPGITPITLSRASGRDKSTITPVLRDLLRDGLVRRSAIPSDRRSYALFLTPDGEEKLAMLAKSAAAHDTELDAIVGERKDELIQALRRIVTLLD